MADKKSGGLTAFVNKHIMPVAAKIGNFKPLIAVRDGIAMAMPLIITGSLFMIINSFPVPGFTSDELIKIVKIVHQHDGLVMSTIGTSQESSGKDVIREIALKNKTCGVDIQHIGDAAWGVLPPTETIFELSKTIRGLNHTISRMARSINR